MKSAITKLLTTIGILAFVCLVALPLMDSGISQITNSESYSTTVKSMVSLFPIMYAILAIIGIIQIWYQAPVIIYHFKWIIYGERMKRAYRAKFGYDNKGFNEEVDQHILTMRTLDEGATRDINEDWLKRMAKFVEIKWKDLSDEASQEVTGGDDYEEVQDDKTQTL